MSFAVIFRSYSCQEARHRSPCVPGSRYAVWNSHLTASRWTDDVGMPCSAGSICSSVRYSPRSSSTPLGVLWALCTTAGFLSVTYGAHLFLSLLGDLSWVVEGSGGGYAACNSHSAVGLTARETRHELLRVPAADMLLGIVTWRRVGGGGF